MMAEEVFIDPRGLAVEGRLSHKTSLNAPIKTQAPPTLPQETCLKPLALPQAFAPFLPIPAVSSSHDLLRRLS